MQTAPALVLNLRSNEQKAAIVVIDGKKYGLRSVFDLSLANVAAIERTSPRIAALLLTDAPTAAETKELTDLLDQACRIALDAPPKVLAALGDVNRFLIYRAFTKSMDRYTRDVQAVFAQIDEGTPRAKAARAR